MRITESEYSFLFRIIFYIFVQNRVLGKFIKCIIVIPLKLMLKYKKKMYLFPILVSLIILRLFNAKLIHSKIFILKN